MGKNPITEAFEGQVSIEKQVQKDEVEVKRKWRRTGNQGYTKGLQFGTDGRRSRLRTKNVARYVRDPDGKLVQVPVDQKNLKGRK